MSGHKDFAELRKKLRAKAGAKAAIEQHRLAMKDALVLADLREARDATQTDVAEALGVTQPNVSRVEHEEDVYLSTLRGYVEALGGTLEIRAVFSDETVLLDAPAG
jgi:DNA-binding XRE family transcriptional regulator